MGVFVGSLIAGHVYGNYGEKATLALKHLGEQPALLARAARAADWSDDLDRASELMGFSEDRALPEVCKHFEVDPKEGGDLLRTLFRHDKGQIENLGLVHLARLDENQGKLAAADPPIDPARAGRETHRLSEALGLSRSEVMIMLREKITAPAGDAQAGMEDLDRVNWLWTTYGDDPGIVEGMAVEFLAQATDRLERAVLDMTIDDPPRGYPRQAGHRPHQELRGLSLARGAVQEDGADEKLAALLAREGFGRLDLEGRENPNPFGVYSYLMTFDHRRYLAVAGKDWSKDKTFLTKLLDGDAEKAERLSDDLYGLQSELNGKDWKTGFAAMEAAGYLMGLNQVEAKALALADRYETPRATTKLLWDAYDPQFKVWIPFAAIGVIAAIALYIFGQMAKRWKDMNA